MREIRALQHTSVRNVDWTKATDRPDAGVFRDDRRDVRRYDVETNWRFFVGSCILATGLLLKAGAPLVPVAVGIAVAALFNWRKHRRVVFTAKKTD
jgi:hypothetical protein